MGGGASSTAKKEKYIEDVKTNEKSDKKLSATSYSQAAQNREVYIKIYISAFLILSLSVSLLITFFFHM